MVCGTCGKAGHNTVKCPQRAAITTAAKGAGYLAGASTGVPLGGTVGKKVGGAAANAALKTDGQKHYEKYGKKK